MKIWVDGDACPGVIKEILFKAARRSGVQLAIIANQPMRVPTADNFEMILVKAGADVADDEIVSRLNAGDLVITADIPLAANVIAKGGYALDPRGELYLEENIGGRLSTRDFMDSLRSSGIDTGGPPPLGKRDRQLFSNNLDKLITKYLRSK
jgi:uncharacterized protein YaiI (UPF0178 family)